MFWRVETRSGLYVFFKTVCDEYGIIEPENYTIPAEAEGVPPAASDFERQKGEEGAPTLMKREPDAGLGLATSDPANTQPESVDSNIPIRSDTTKRHRHNLSSLSNSAAIIPEVEEEPEETNPEQPPSLPRQPTALLATPEMNTPIDNEPEEEEGEEHQEPDLPPDEEEQPKLGVLRTDTLRPPKAEEHPDDIDDTVTPIEPPTPTPTHPPTNPEIKSEEVVQLPPAPAEITQEEPAADAEEATKTVGD